MNKQTLQRITQDHSHHVKLQNKYFEAQQKLEEKMEVARLQLQVQKALSKLSSRPECHEA
jgi:hypothetical protein